MESKRKMEVNRKITRPSPLLCGQYNKPSALRGSDSFLLHGWTSLAFSQSVYVGIPVPVSWSVSFWNSITFAFSSGDPAFLCAPSTNRSRHGTVFEIKGTSSWSKLLICHLFCLPLSLGSWPRWHFCLVACPTPVREQNFSFLNMDARAHSGCCFTV